jgi:hypothetical protein
MLSEKDRSEKIKNVRKTAPLKLTIFNLNISEFDYLVKFFALTYAITITFQGLWQIFLSELFDFVMIDLFLIPFYLLPFGAIMIKQINKRSGEGVIFFKMVSFRDGVTKTFFPNTNKIKYSKH